MNIISNYLKLTLACIAAILLLLISPVHADKLDKIVETGIVRTEEGKASQEKIDQSHDAAGNLLNQFKHANKMIDGLKIYNKLLQKQVDNQLQQTWQLMQSIQVVALIGRQIMPLMVRMIDSLEQFIELDIPFLPEERNERVANLRTMLERPDVSITEKYRRVLEAYQIEIEYGKTIKAYRGTLTLNETERDVEFLRIGRVAFLYQTIGAEQTGAWDKQNKIWTSLPSNQYRIPVTKAIRIAKKQIAPDLLIMPISSAETIQ